MKNTAIAILWDGTKKAQEVRGEKSMCLELKVQFGVFKNPSVTEEWIMKWWQL